MPTLPCCRDTCSAGRAVRSGLSRLSRQVRDEAFYLLAGGFAGSLGATEIDGVGRDEDRIDDPNFRGTVIGNRVELPVVLGV